MNILIGILLSLIGSAMILYSDYTGDLLILWGVGSLILMAGLYYINSTGDKQ